MRPSIVDLFCSLHKEAAVVLGGEIIRSENENQVAKQT